MTDTVIPAATILLLRDEPQFEVLMIERHENIGFAGGAVVFPGGRLGKGDHDPRWQNRAKGFDAIAEEQRAPRIAAIREAFEETGMLFAYHTGKEKFVDDAFVQSLHEWRKPVENDDEKFFELIEQENLVLATEQLRLFARWAPPKEATHKRFDTWFFAARAPADQRAREDGNEATDAIWISPKAVLDARIQGERKMIFPTVRNVELLGVKNSVDETLAFAAERKIALVQPFVVERDGGKHVAIPDDLGYPVTSEPIETAFRL